MPQSTGGTSDYYLKMNYWAPVKVGGREICVSNVFQNLNPDVEELSSEMRTAGPVCPVIVERTRVLLVLGSSLGQRLTCLVMLDKYDCPVEFPGEP